MTLRCFLMGHRWRITRAELSPSLLFSCRRCLLQRFVVGEECEVMGRILMDFSWALEQLGARRRVRRGKWNKGDALGIDFLDLERMVWSEYPIWFDNLSLPDLFANDWELAEVPDARP